jgi:Methylamine utilisation protein MauE
MNFSQYNKFSEIIAAVFILLFTYTALSKLFDLHNFEFTLNSSPLISRWSSTLAWTLPAIELIAAFLLLIPSTRLLGFYLSLVLMSLFTCYISFMLFYSSNPSCSCGCILRQLSWKDHWILNIVLTVLACTAIILEIKIVKSSRPVVHT